MGFFRGSLVFVLSFFLIVSLIFLVFGFGAKTLISAETYTDSLEEAGFYDFVDENVQNLTGGGFVENLNETIDNGITEIVDYVNGEDENITLTVKIDQEALRSFFISQAEKFPACGEGESSYENGDVRCIPIGVSAEEFLDDYLEENNISILEKEEVDLAEVYGLTEGSEGKKALDMLRKTVSIYKKVLYVLIIVAIVIICLILLLYLTQIRKGARWIGVDFFAAGAVSIAIIFLIKEFLSGLLLKSNELALGFVLNLGNFVNEIYAVFFQRVLIYSILLGVIGIGLIVTSIFFLKEKVKEE